MATTGTAAADPASSDAVTTLLPDTARLVRAAAGGATVLAGVLHTAAVVGHVDARWWVPVFFAVVAAGQLAMGLWLLRSTPPRGVAEALVGVTVGLVLLFLVVHGTTWLGDLAGHLHHEEVTGHAHAEGPVALGASEGAPEPADALRLVTLAVQGVAVTAGTLLLRHRARVADLLVVLAAGLVLAWTTGVLT